MSDEITYTAEGHSFPTADRTRTYLRNLCGVRAWRELIKPKLIGPEDILRYVAKFWPELSRCVRIQRQNYVDCECKPHEECDECREPEVEVKYSEEMQSRNEQLHRELYTQSRLLEDAQEEVRQLKSRVFSLERHDEAYAPTFEQRGHKIGELREKLAAARKEAGELRVALIAVKKEREELSSQLSRLKRSPTGQGQQQHLDLVEDLRAEIRDLRTSVQDLRIERDIARGANETLHRELEDLGIQHVQTEDAYKATIKILEEKLDRADAELLAWDCASTSDLRLREHATAATKEQLTGSLSEDLIVQANKAWSNERNQRVAAEREIAELKRTMKVAKHQEALSREEIQTEVQALRLEMQHTKSEVQILVEAVKRQQKILVTMIENMPELGEAIVRNTSVKDLQGLGIRREGLDRIAADVAKQVLAKVHEKFPSDEETAGDVEELRDALTKQNQANAADAPGAGKLNIKPWLDDDWDPETANIEEVQTFVAVRGGNIMIGDLFKDAVQLRETAKKLWEER
jgi:chromosome segregation ATPase